MRYEQPLWLHLQSLAIWLSWHFVGYLALLVVCGHTFNSWLLSFLGNLWPLHQKLATWLSWQFVVAPSAVGYLVSWQLVVEPSDDSLLRRVCLIIKDSTVHWDTCLSDLVFAPFCKGICSKWKLSLSLSLSLSCLCLSLSVSLCLPKCLRLSLSVFLFSLSSAMRTEN